MLRFVTIGFILLIAVAKTAGANDDAQFFWSRFREAVISGNSGEVACMTKFPLWVRGPDDSDPVVYYGKKDFAKILRRLLGQEVSTWKSGKVVTKKMLQIIKEKEKLTSADLQDSNFIVVEMFHFERLKGKWYLTRGYVEDGAY